MVADGKRLVGRERAGALVHLAIGIALGAANLSEVEQLGCITGRCSDETGDVKKGTHTVGVNASTPAPPGGDENAQVAVYLVYAGHRGHAAADREL